MFGTAVLWMALASSPAIPTTARPADDCYDVKVLARVVQQIPSEIPDCGDDCIMSWPWFLQLKVRRVLDGQLAGDRVDVLTVQHTYLQSKYGVWFLRRNGAGGYNAPRFAEDGKTSRCAADAPLARPYLGTGNAQEQDALREAGRRRYGDHSN